MPISTSSITTTAGTSLVKVTIPIEKGNLRAISIFDPGIQYTPGITFCQASLSFSGDQVTDRCIILATGQVGGISSISWHGLIPTEPAMQIIVMAQSTQITTMRISILTSDILQNVKTAEPK